MNLFDECFELVDSGFVVAVLELFEGDGEVGGQTVGGALAQV
jgi:hypothetical protein